MVAAWRRLALTLLRIALLTVVYAGVGAAALQLAIPPGYAAPIFPPAGIMLAAGVIYGYGVLPAAFLGSLLMRSIALGGLLDGSGALQSVGLVVSLASTLQAAIGIRLAKSLCGPEPALDTPPTIVRFVLLCPLVALVGSSISIAALLGWNVIASANAVFDWWNWWLGDTLGMLVGVPIMFALFGRPRENWSARKWTVALPLLVMIGLGVATAGVITRWEDQRIEARFKSDAQKLADAFRNELRLDVLAVQAAALGHARFDDAAESIRWMNEAPSIVSIGRVSIPKAGGGAVLSVVADATGRRAEVAGMLRAPVVHAALERALVTGQIAASEPWTFDSGPERHDEFLVWIPGSVSAPGAGAQEAVYAVINVRRLDPRLLVDGGTGLAICWVDRTGTGVAHRIAGPADCERPVVGHPLKYEATMPLWGRDWLVRVVATPRYAGALRSWGPWAFSALAVLAIGTTGAFLLLLTGRAQTVGRLVQQRTAELEREKAALRGAEQLRLVAEEARHAKDEFLSRMSHELRTPLNAILGFAQILSSSPDEPLSGQQRRQIGHIETAGWHLLAMIDDLLDLSRIEAGTIRLSLEPTPLDVVIGDTVTMLSSLASRNAVAVRVDIEPGVSRVLADVTRLKQVLANLLSNAIKYSSSGGSVTISARPVAGARVAITVSDAGQGMSAQQLSELFQPFNRLGRETGPVPGTGIGLVVTKKLTELMGGTIEVSSVEAQGSAFSVSLPAARAVAVIEPPAAPPVDAAARYGSRRVAYFEDNPLNAEVMRAVLSARPQVRLDVYAQAAEGLAAIRNEAVDLLLMDMSLPDARGIDVLRSLKADPSTMRTPVIIVSADTVAEHVREALRSGAFAYIVKPIERAQVLEQIDRALASAPA